MIYSGSVRVLLVALGLVWSIWCPIIKLLWTSSFVLVTGGLSAIVMGVFYLLIDVLGIPAMGLSVYCNRNERAGRLHGYDAVRLPAHRAYLRRQSSSAHWCLGRRTGSFDRIRCRMADPAVDVQNKDIREGLRLSLRETGSVGNERTGPVIPSAGASCRRFYVSMIPCFGSSSSGSFKPSAAGPRSLFIEPRV